METFNIHYKFQSIYTPGCRFDRFAENRIHSNITFRFVIEYIELQLMIEC